MVRFILMRILASIPVMFVVAAVVFAILRLSAGDPAAIIAGDSATPEQLEQLRQTMGLDRPIYIQFFMWLSHILQGDFGVSLLSGVSVVDMIGQRMGPSVALALTTIVFAVLVAIPLGVIAAWRQGKLLDRCVMGLSVLGFSVPVFVSAYILVLIFSLQLGWFPVQGYHPLSEGIIPFLSSITLPTIALSSVYIALIARITRTSMIEVMGEDFVRTARAKGMKESRVLLHHALRNAATPIITIIGIGIAMLIGGVVVTESVFNLPGLGRLVVEAVLARDYPVIQGLILLFALVYVVINLVVDVLYTVFDPRIRY